MTAQRELELLQKDFEKYQASIQNKINVAVDRIIQSVSANELTVDQGYQAMRGVYYAMNGLDSNNYLMDLVNLIEKQRVGVGAEVVRLGDHMVMRIEGDDKVHIVSSLRQIDLPSDPEERQDRFKKVVEYMKDKTNAN